MTTGQMGGALAFLIGLAFWFGTREGEPVLQTSGDSADTEIAAVQEDDDRQKESQNDAKKEDRKKKIPTGVDFYKGRRIAQYMSFHGAPWLTRDEREVEERCSLLLANLGLKRGMTVCDLGCGNGFHTLKMAELVGEKGAVLAVDIQPEMLSLLRERMEFAGIENVTPILGSIHNPRLPKESVDLILLVDVYHEFSHPEPMLKAMRDALKPDGRIALVEYREEDPDVPIKRLHKMSKKQILKEFPPNGFKLVEEFDKLPWQHLMFFGKDDSPRKDATSERNQK